MAKNFDYILLLAKEVPGFKRLYEYCDMAETLQATYPEASDFIFALQALQYNNITVFETQKQP